MKTNQITMQAGTQAAAKPAGAGSKLRAAINKMTPGSSARQQDTFDSALTEARDSRSSQGTATRQTVQAGRETTAAARPGADSEPDKRASVSQPGKDAKTEKDAGMSAKDTAASAKDAMREMAEEASAETVGLVKQEKSGQSEVKASADADAEAEVKATDTEPAATTLNAMLMAMAVQTDAVPAAETFAETEAVSVEAASSVTAMTDSLPQASESALSDAVAQNAASQAAEPLVALDSLLPQDAGKTAQAAQNQQLMDMLSGNTASVNLATQPKAMSAEAAVNVPQAMAVADEAAITPGQLGRIAESAMVTPELTDVAAANVNAGLEAAMPVASESVTPESGLPENVAGNMPVQPEAVRAGAENAVNLANAAQVVSSSSRAEVRSAADNVMANDSGKSIWQGIPVMVEEAVSMPRDDSNRQNLGDMLRQQNQEQAALAETTAQTTADGETLPGAAFTPSLAEEAVPGAGQQQSPSMTVANAFAPATGMANAVATAETAAPESAAPVRDTYEVVRQIVDQARLIRSGESTEMVIRLRPEHLGEITLRVAITAEGIINASFRSDNAQVRAILESSMVQLKQQLQEQGVKVDNVDVQSGLSEDFFSQSQAGQQGYQQSQQSSARSQQLARQAFADDAEGLSATVAAPAAASETGQPSVGADAGVDYRV